MHEIVVKYVVTEGDIRTDLTFLLTLANEFLL
jgi:hypothetical protein